MKVEKQKDGSISIEFDDRDVSRPSVLLTNGQAGNAERMRFDGKLAKELAEELGKTLADDVQQGE